MSKPTRNPVDDLRGASRLAIDATVGITALVEEMHRTIGAGPAVLGRPLSAPVGALTRVVYGGVGGAAELFGVGFDRALAGLAPIVGTASPTLEHEAALAVVNGVLGDHLEATDNPLAIPMQLRVDGRPLPLTPEAIASALPDRTGKLLVLVHGSSMNDRQWLRGGHDHGRELALDLGFTRVYLHYNSGRHISTNGADFADLLDQLVHAWPGPDIEQLVLLTHSMGGLVARSACAVAEERDLSWRSLVRAMVFLATPHHGAPLERGGNWIDALLGVSRYSAPLARLGKIRSAGVTDLRFGSLRDADWAGRDRFTKTPDLREPLPLPEGVACFAIAGKLPSKAPSTLRSKARSTVLPGDGLVPVDSALGVHKEPAQRLAFADENTWIAEGASHLDVLSSAEVYARLRDWVASVG